MGAKAKIGISIILIIIVVLAVWQLTSPRSIPDVGTKYTQPGPFSQQGEWIQLEKTSSGMVYLGFSIANTTFPRTALSTTYSIIISKLNETINSSYTTAYTVRVTSLTVQDNYDGKFTGYDTTGQIPDAVQVTTLFHFSTSATHEIRFTISYDVYNLLFFGYTLDHSQTRSFNITQTIT
jgi:hypothetical protein